MLIVKKTTRRRTVPHGGWLWLAVAGCGWLQPGMEMKCRNVVLATAENAETQLPYLW
jgi:hypothetical protein